MSTTRRTRFLKYLSAPHTQLVEISTDEMKDRGIHQGDLVLADPGTKPKPGELAIQEENGKLLIQVANEKRKGGKVMWVLKEV